MEFAQKPPTWQQVQDMDTTLVIMNGKLSEIQLLVVLYELYVLGVNDLNRVTVDLNKQKEAADFLGEASPSDYGQLARGVSRVLSELEASLSVGLNRQAVGFGSGSANETLLNKHQLWQGALESVRFYDDALIGLKVFFLAKQGGTLKSVNVPGFRKDMEAFGLVSETTPTEDLVFVRQHLDILSTYCRVDTGRW